MRDGWRFDIGGHRFFTKVKPVDDLWFEILGADDFLRRPRMSHIYYRGKLYDYPIKPLNALRNLGPGRGRRGAWLSYLWARVRPPKNQDTLEGYVVARLRLAALRPLLQDLQREGLGRARRRRSPADWGAQRIKDMSLVRGGVGADHAQGRSAAATRRSRSRASSRSSTTRSTAPARCGRRCTELVTDAGGDRGVRLRRHPHRARRRRAPPRSPRARGRHEPHATTAPTSISSMPIERAARGDGPAGAGRACSRPPSRSRYRDFMTVALVVPEEYGFPDNWIYIHDPDVEVGRIQNFGRWSPYLVKDGRTCLGLEFFVQRGRRDVDQGRRRARRAGQARARSTSGLVDPAKVEAGYVVRTPKAYPFYDGSTRRTSTTLRRWLEEHTAQRVSRWVATACTATTTRTTRCSPRCSRVENIFGADHDVWSVNVEEEYHEEVARRRRRAAPVVTRPGRGVAGDRGRRVRGRSARCTSRASTRSGSSA